MRIENCRKNFVPLLLLAASVCAAQANPPVTGQLWFGGQGPATGTASGFSDNRAGHVNSDGSYPTTVVVDPGSTSCLGVGVDTAANLYFGFWSDGSLRSGNTTGGQLQQLQITDVSADDDALSFAVDPAHHLIYLGLWGNDPTGADLIKITYNPTNGQMVSPYDPVTGMITNAAGVLLSEVSTTNNFVLPRQMWVAPGGGELYYADNDNGDPFTFAGVMLNGVYVVNTTVTNPQPKLLSLDSEFPGDETNGYIVGLAVNKPDSLIYFATTAGSAPGMGTGSNAIWCMPLAGGPATNMPMPAGVSLVYPNFNGGCLALDTNAQVLYVSDEGQGTVLQLSLSANGTGFSGGTTNFFTLDPDHLNDGANGYPSAFTQGLDFVPVVVSTPPALLSIVRQGTDVVLSWPLADSSYALQVASVLATNAWMNYPGPLSINGSVISVTNAMSGGQEFFRLSQ
jgi:hypothetical protein